MQERQALSGPGIHLAQNVFNEVLSPPRNVVPSWHAKPWHRWCSVSPVLPPGQRNPGIWHTDLAPDTLPTTADHQKPSPAMAAPKIWGSEANGMAGRAQPAWPTPHLCLFGNFRFKEQGRASSPVPIPAPGDEAENSPEGPRSSATQKTQRRGTCRSGRSCSRCRVCLSFQGPETEADEESEAGFMLISLTQAGSALTQQ